MKFLYILLCFSLSFVSFNAVEKKGRLQFVPNFPVYLNSEVSLNINQSLPGLSLSTRGVQKMQAIIAIQSASPDLPVTKPPFDLSFILKSLKISIKVNDEELSFNSEDSEPSLYLNQVSKLIDRPIMIHFGEGVALIDKNGELQQIVRELPVFQEINPADLLVDLFYFNFGLAGEELKEGKIVERTLLKKSNPSQPDKVTYTITAIDDYNIHASIKGDVEKQPFTLEGKVKINQDQVEPVYVTLKGTMEGNGKWNRDNSMLNDLELHYSYAAVFKLAEYEWMMQVTVDVHNSTKLK